MLIKKLKIVPDLEGISNFEEGKDQVQSIIMNKENIIKIRFNDNNLIKSIDIPTEGSIKLEYESSSEWDGKLILIQGNEVIYYKKGSYPKEALESMARFNNY